MAARRNNDLSPWDDDEQRNQDALQSLLTERSGATPAAPSTDVNTTMPVTDAPTVAETVNPPVAPKQAPQVFQGFQPKHAMEGFDFNREQNTGKSAKDAFAFLANQAPPPPIHDKQALGAWFNQYIKPGMNALGHNAEDATGDSFRFKNWQGDFTVDYGRGAGAEGGALAWQVDPGTEQMAQNATYTPQSGQPQRQAPSIDRVPMPTNTGDSALDQIVKEIEALARGGTTPMEATALQQLLLGGS